MENCLVKKYKSSVNDSTLEYFDALQFRALWNSNFTSVALSSSAHGIFVGGIGAKIKVLNNGYIEQGGVNKGKEITMAADMGNVNIVPESTSTPTEYLVIGFSKITNLYMSTTSPIELRNPELLKYTPNNSIVWDNVMYFYAPWGENSPCSYDFIDSLVPVKTGITSLRLATYSDEYHLVLVDCSILKKFDSITNFSFSNYYFRPVGNISNMNVFTGTTNITFRDERAYGDIASLGTMTLLTTLNCSGSRISGSLNELVENLYQNGKKSASSSSRIHIYFGTLSDIRLNGVTQRTTGYLAWDDGGSAPTNIRIENS